MTDFIKFKMAVDKQFTKMSKLDLFRTDVDKDVLWAAYLASFPKGTNPIFRERTEHDCQCCKQFIRAGGNTVAIVRNRKISIWDIKIGGHYQVVADTLSTLVKSAKIENEFLHVEKHLGTDFNNQVLENGETIKWNHFHFELPVQFVKRGVDIGTALSRTRASKDVFMRGLTEISLDAVETVLELIEQNSIYRGAEHKAAVKGFLVEKKRFEKLKNDESRDNYCWSNLGPGAKIRNTAIGTLLTDISDGIELDKAVQSFESKVAPTNYKRTSALITKGMIANAKKKVAALGLESALHRRYAVTEDVTINNVLFADRSVKPVIGNMFDELETNTAPVDVSKLKKLDEVPIKTFIDDILPKSESIEILFDNGHVNNLMSLIAPVHDDAKHLFKWDNNFSWAYNGEVADSIKERVKRAGGNIDAYIRCSLAWFNFDDLDIHVVEPDGNRIFYSHKNSYKTGGRLDVDMNANVGTSREAVENIVWTNKAKMLGGTYQVYINQFQQRESVDVGFDAEIEFDGVIHTYHYAKRVVGNVPVAEFRYSKNNGIKLIGKLPSTQASKEVWGLATQKFHKVKMIMNSPNHWDDKTTGNKHLFFIVEDCKNDEPARGFFNEFLDERLRAERKVFEVLGSKMKTEKSDHQLSGLGFSTTQKTQILVKVTGSFARTIKVNI